MTEEELEYKHAILFGGKPLFWWDQEQVEKIEKEMLAQKRKFNLDRRLPVFFLIENFEMCIDLINRIRKISIPFPPDYSQRVICPGWLHSIEVLELTSSEEKVAAVWIEIQLDDQIHPLKVEPV